MKTRRSVVLLFSLLVVAALFAGTDAFAQAQAGAPANLSRPTVSGSAVVGGTFTATKGTWNGSPTRYTYVWKDCDTAGLHCVSVPKATAATYVIAQSDAGHTMKAVVKAWNASGSGSARSAKTAVVAAAGDTTPPSKPAGFAATGSTSTSISTSWSAATDNVGVTGYDAYNGSTKAGTTSSTTYTFSGLTCGTTYTFGVSAHDAAGNVSGRATLSAATVACGGSDTTPPTMPTALGASSPSATQLKLTWTASTDNVAVSGYHAFLNGASAGDTTATSYSYGTLSCGTSYTLGVSAYDAKGNTSAVNSMTATTSPCATAPGPNAAPAVTGTAQVGQTLSTTNGTWTGTAPFTYTYQWQSCDTAGANCATITGATAATYTLASAQQGHTVRARVTASNSAGSSSAVSAQTAVVQAAQSGGLTGLHVSGNQLVNGSGAAVHLHGVNYAGPEYACIQGWGIFDGPSDSASVKAIASWHSNIVHIGLNEDCILGINGVPAAYAGANYMNAITAYVNLLHANGLYAEVSLMWAAPGTQQALDHPEILDQDHAPAALQAIANAFKNDPNTIIGLQSEPHAISWACWLNGGSSCSVGYTALGMQGALNAVRSTGATNVVTASGINYANDLSAWLTNKPNDPLGQIIAEAHVYGGNGCASTSCFNTNYAPVAAQVPMIFGETGETYDDSSCGSTNIATFMNWADAHGVGYEAWVWDTWGTCGSLISDYNGTPANAYATWVKSHYATQP